MKPISKIILTVLAALLITCTANSPKKNPIFGTWKKINTAKSVGNVSNEAIVITQSFTPENTFQTIIKTPEGNKIIGNWGNFYLVNDTTMVTFHKDQAGNLDHLANTYYFKIRNDSMHFHGYYLGQTPANQAILNKIWIDEYWVRIKKN
jgi:hypothetical protein